MGLTDEERSTLIAYRLQRANESLVEARDVFRLQHYILAINRLYYACFYAMSAMLIKDGHSAVTHAGIRSLMGKLYVKTGMLSRQEGKLFSDLFNLRHTGDYGDSFDIDQSDVEEYLQPTIDLVSKIKVMINSSFR